MTLNLPSGFWLICPLVCPIWQLSICRLRLSDFWSSHREFKGSSPFWKETLEKIKGGNKFDQRERNLEGNLHVLSILP